MSKWNNENINSLPLYYKKTKPFCNLIFKSWMLMSYNF
jgi:hypothetical protein